MYDSYFIQIFVYDKNKIERKIHDRRRRVTLTNNEDDYLLKLNKDGEYEITVVDRTFQKLTTSGAKKNFKQIVKFKMSHGEIEFWKEEQLSKPRFFRYLRCIENYAKTIIFDRKPKSHWYNYPTKFLRW